ncbi:pyridoxamine 5'-phosphate oxidase family protein [Roseovarius sp. MMSF_3281]|uniref:pyridoxamine 5'-phosphate oxidase family protein n=1 Tax=Roseovarius sp. MMSF_3281 TaxID=3046694 RepID=UPI00273E7BC2|nr:pyridoxamine 5'-phosphate oxidase family protein [Roseovarius sp. MMSF_3281]
MADIADLKREFWRRLEDQTAGMMGVEGTQMHMRPMTPYVDPEKNSVWFLCAPDNQLAQAEDTGKAHFTMQSPDEKFYACVSGRLDVSRDEKKLGELWNIFASAFFEGGPDDSDAILLEFKVEEAEVWTVEAGGMQFAAEIARSAFGDKDHPDLGTHEVIRLN